MTVETTCNRRFWVRETNIPGLDHVWYGIELKKDGTPKKGVREVMVRKAGSRIVKEG